MDVRKTMNDLRDLGLQQETFHENMTWDEYVDSLDKYANNDKKLKAILNIKASEELIDGITLNDIMTTNFVSAKQTIDQMTLAKRIAVLEELDKYRSYLYESIGKWGREGIPKDEQLSANDFRVLLGRIKHLEILQNWLYGIE